MYKRLLILTILFLIIIPSAYAVELNESFNQTVSNSSDESQFLGDAVYENQKSDDGDNPDASADLELTKTSDKKHVKVGDTVILTIKVTNHGPDKARDVVVEDHSFENLELINQVYEKGTFDSQERFWFIDELDVNETAILQLFCRVMSEFSKNEYGADAVSSTPDPNQQNNNDSCIIYCPADNRTHENPIGKNANELYAAGNPIFILALTLLILPITLKKNK